MVQQSKKCRVHSRNQRVNELVSEYLSKNSKKKVISNHVVISEKKIDDDSNSYIRFYSHQQIMKLKRHNHTVDKDYRVEQRFAWMKLKNILLGITEKDLLSIEKKEWNKVSRNSTVLNKFE